MNELISITTGGQGLPVVSSLDVATGLGIRHKSLLETIRTYQQAVEENFGLVAFETAAVKQAGQRGAKHQTVAYLTEDQALFVGTLSRNSRRVMAFKATLVKSFSEARRRIRETIQPTVSPEVTGDQQEARITKLERQIGRLIDIQLQAGRIDTLSKRSSI